MKPAAAGAPYYVPPEPKRLPSFLLAVGVHAVLLVFLYFGISWQSNTPVAVEAEVWDVKVETAAAPELPPEPAPEPPPQPEPQPTPRAVEPPPVERPAPTPPDIALEREKQRKEEQLKKEQEKRELAEQKKREQEEARKKELAEQKKKEEAERKEKELAAKKEAEAKKKEQEKKLAEAKKKAAAEQARLDKIRQEDLKRFAGAMGSGGNAEKSSAPKADSGYVAAITAKIKSNTTYAGNLDVPGNPKAVFKVDQLPTGEIMSVRLAKSSGVPEFDRAVENGIRKASPLPKKKDGTVERNLEVNFSMKDLD